jgi:hypothetical protein
VTKEINNKKVGRPALDHKRETISVRIDPELLQQVRDMPELSLTQAVENGLKLVLAYKTIELIKVKP